MRIYEISPVSVHFALVESCQNLTESQQRIVKGIYREFKPLYESNLTAAQVAQAFSNAETSLTTAGGNRTVVGQGKDVVDKANQVINNIGKWLQDTTPVQAFDQKFENLKSTIQKKFPDNKLVTSIASMGEWAKANPGKTAAVVGVLTAIASLAAGPVGGAIAGQILRGTAELLKGEKLSTAVGKGVKTAALGYLSGKAFEVIGDWIGDMRAESIPFGPKDAGLNRVNYGATRELTAPGFSHKETLQGFNVVVLPDEEYAINTAMKMIDRAEPGGFDMLKKVAQEIRSPEYREIIDDIMKGSRVQQLNNDSLMQWIDGLKNAASAISQGAATTVGMNQPSTSLRAATPGTTMTNEGIRDAFSKAVGAVGSKISTMGKNLTTKVTADKLQKAWKSAGSPLDSEAVASVMVNSGVDKNIVADVFSKMSIPAPTFSQPAATAAKPAAQPAATAAKPAAQPAATAAIPTTQSNLPRATVATDTITPSKVTYKGQAAPAKPVANFAKTGFTGYKQAGQQSAQKQSAVAEKQKFFKKK